MNIIVEILNYFESAVEDDGVQRYRTNVQSQKKSLVFRIEQGAFFSHIRRFFYPVISLYKIGKLRIFIKSRKYMTIIMQRCDKTL